MFDLRGLFLETTETLCAATIKQECAPLSCGESGKIAWTWGRDHCAALLVGRLMAKRVGRPPFEFQQDVADAICESIARGNSLKLTLEVNPLFPRQNVIFKWLAATPSFAKQYADARAIQADVLAEECVTIADEEIATVRRGDDEQEVVFDSTAVARNRLRVDARKWYASKLLPKKYGDRTAHEVTGPNGGPVQQVTMTQSEFIDAAKRIASDV